MTLQTAQLNSLRHIKIVSCAMFSDATEITGEWQELDRLLG